MKPRSQLANTLGTECRGQLKHFLLAGDLLGSNVSHPTGRSIKTVVDTNSKSREWPGTNPLRQAFSWIALRRLTVIIKHTP